MNVIKVENLSKQYRLGNVGLGSLSHDLNRWYQTTLRRREDPYLKIGEANDRAVKGESEYVWALQNINFEVQQGEVLGIIGRNGAGKSTLLKILSRTTTPTTGQIKIKGRVASLLEVGTGFHPELTGRENIFLNGAILGMTKREIKSKFDEIVDFAGVERYIDTPVKRYSSGMYVRLAFGVAAHLEPEILIVDEVLAVGDAEFQKKALGKMKDVSGKDGRTVLFVSHNMAAVRNLCDKGLLLVNGSVNYLGNTDDTIREYLSAYQIAEKTEIENNTNRSGDNSIQFAGFHMENSNGSIIDRMVTGENLTFVFLLKRNDDKVTNVDLGYSIHDLYGDPITNLYTSYQNMIIKEVEKERIQVRCTIKNFSIAPGKYFIKGRLLANNLEADWLKSNLGMLEVEAGDFYNTGALGSIDWNSKYLIRGDWKW